MLSKREQKFQLRLTQNKRIMDKQGISRPISLLIGLSFLLLAGHLSVLLAAAQKENEMLQGLSYILLVPSVIIVTTLMITNWYKTVKYFVTFEEITKADLDTYFLKINKEKHFANGLEWSTAQLGHFWIELRIKNPNIEEPAEEDDHK